MLKQSNFHMYIRQVFTATILKALIQDRIFFIIMFQLRSHLVTLGNGIHLVRIDILSILNQVLVISFQKLTPTLLNLLNIISILIKLEVQLMSHPRLALHEWNGGNIWYIYKFLKLQSFMMSNTLYVVLQILLVDKSIQFYLFRIHNISLVHPILKNCLGTQFRKNTSLSDGMRNRFCSR